MKTRMGLGETRLNLEETQLCAKRKILGLEMTRCIRNGFKKRQVGI